MIWIVIGKYFNINHSQHKVLQATPSDVVSKMCYTAIGMSWSCQCITDSNTSTQLCVPPYSSAVLLSMYLSTSVLYLLFVIFQLLLDWPSTTFSKLFNCTLPQRLQRISLHLAKVTEGNSVFRRVCSALCFARIKCKCFRGPRVGESDCVLLRNFRLYYSCKSMCVCVCYRID